MDSKTFFDNFEIIANAPGGITRLRELILDLAVRGKLTEQISNERRLEIPESDGFFVIPDNWVWSTLEEIADYGGRGSKSPNEIVDADWVLDLEDIEKSTSRLLNRVRSKDRQTTSTKARFEKGDVLYGKLRPYLDKVLVADTPGYCTTEIVPITPKFGLDPQWLRISLKSPMFIGYVTEKSYGMKMPRLGTKDAKASLHAVPPIEEQKRIVSRVDELMALCDELEAAQNQRNSIRTTTRKSAIDAISTATTPDELNAAWKRISDNWLTVTGTPESITALRSLILDLAVRGSLVSPKVGSHQVPIIFDLEKLKLDEDKLWKLNTALPEPAQGWNRVPMARLGQWGSGGTPTASRKEYYSNGTIPWAVIGDLNSSVMLTTESLITQKALEASSTKMIPIGAVLVAMYGASIGKSAISGIECCTNQAIAHCVVDEDVITSEYMFLVVKSLKDHLIEMGKGAAQPNISQSVLKHLVIDIPPLSVQKRVIERTDELLDLCNQLELSLIERNELTKKIAGSLANEAAA
jgi:type I restriction enzyme S subunit